MGEPAAVDNRSSLNIWTNKSFNFIADASEFILGRTGKVLAPALLGYIGGCVTGLGGHIGLFQGSVAGAYYVVFKAPLDKYVKHNGGTGPNDITYKTARFFDLIGVVSSFAVPVILTSYLGASVMASGLSLLAEDNLLRWIIESPQPHVYTVIRGSLVNIAPVLVQYAIAALRDVEKETKRS